jgi:hypothetical protein
MPMMAIGTLDESMADMANELWGRNERDMVVKETESSVYGIDNPLYIDY